ncbi:MAG: hypothetical protein EBR82_15045 [Caulobacteraceae bacterium]|nr:hypothetical protein [Caulobacteraceae bacterium]
MPDISYGISLTINKDNLVNQVSATNIAATMDVAGLKSVTYTLTTNATSISTANLSSVGVAFLRNLSTATASTAQIGIEAGGSFVSFSTLKAGEPQLFRLSAGTDYKAVGKSGTRLRVDITEG